MLILLILGTLLFVISILIGQYSDNDKFGFPCFILSFCLLFALIPTNLISNHMIKADGYEIVEDASYITKSGVIESFNKIIYEKDGKYYENTSPVCGSLWPFIEHNFEEIEAPNIFNIEEYITEK